MPKTPVKTESEIEQEELELQGKINGYQQLLDNSRDQLIAGYEGLLTQTEFDKVREDRRMWSEELAKLKGETTAGQEMTTDIIEQIENAGGIDGGAFPSSRYTPEEIVGAVEGLLDGLLGGA